jgi:uncharacterized membrane protein (DUF373 family)
MNDRAHNVLRLVLVAGAVTLSIAPVKFLFGQRPLSKVLAIVSLIELFAVILIHLRHHKSESVPDVSDAGIVKRWWILTMHTDAWCCGTLGAIGTATGVVALFLEF